VHRKSRRSISRFARRACAALLCFWTATGPAAAADRDKTAFLLTGMGIKPGVDSEYYLKSVQLRDAVSGDRITLAYDPEDRHRLVAVRPGRYYVSRIATPFINVLPATFKEPARLCEVEAGRVNYIGDILVYGSEVPGRGFQAQYEHQFNPETLQSAMADSDGPHAGLPVQMAQPGMPPRIIDAGGLVEDLLVNGETGTTDLVGLHQLPDRAWWLRLLGTRDVRTCAITSTRIVVQLGTALATGEVAWKDGAGKDRITLRPDRITAAGPTTEFTLQRTRDVPDLPCIAELYRP
jgi:hypothetical protein